MGHFAVTITAPERLAVTITATDTRATSDLPTLTLAQGAELGPALRIHGVSTLTGGPAVVTNYPNAVPPLAGIGIAYWRIQNALTGTTWTALDAALTLLLENNIVPVLVCSGGDEPTDLAAYGDRISDAFEHIYTTYGETVAMQVVWSPGNEFLDWTSALDVWDTFVASLSAAAESFLPGSPINVIAPCIQRTDFYHLNLWLQHLEDNGGWPSGNPLALQLGVHFYEKGSSATVYPDVRTWMTTLRTYLAAHGFEGKSITFTETGLDGTAKDVRLRTEYNAAWTARHLARLTETSAGQVNTIFASGGVAQAYDYVSPETGTPGGMLGLRTLDSANLPTTAHRAIEMWNLFTEGATLYALDGANSTYATLVGGVTDGTGYLFWNLSGITWTVRLDVGNNDPRRVAVVSDTYGNSYARWLAEDEDETHSGIFALTDGTTRPSVTPTNNIITLSMPTGLFYIGPEV